jgi:hypothetical protein
MMIGGRSNFPIKFSSISMISGTWSCSIGVGSARSASTSNPGYAV